MPLRAVVAGQEVIAPLLSEADSLALRDSGAPIVLPCCGSTGYLRRSPLGTLHFAHKRGAHCDAQGETIYHLKAKADIVLACQQTGYAALTEVAGEGWRADVLAVRGDTRIAFEVQWSFLRLADAIYRQERYARAGVRGCWFFRNPPPQLLRGDDLKASPDLPLFHLFANGDHSFSAAVNGRLYELGTVVQALLAGQIHFCKIAHARPDQHLRLLPFEIACPHCGRPTHIFYIEPHLIARCGHPFKLKDHPYTFALRRDLLAAALPRLAGDSRLGAVTSAGFHCVHCAALIDQSAVDLALYGSNRLASAAAIDLDVHLRQPIIGGAPHWCFPDDGVFCCER